MRKFNDMKKRLFSYVRISVCSISAVAVASCAKMGGMADNGDVEPRRSDAPEDLLNAHMERGRIDWEEQRIDALESELQAVNLELRGLRRALEMMGPFDDIETVTDALVEPTDPGDVMARVPNAGPIHLTKQVAQPQTASFDLSEVYAQPPGAAAMASIFHGAQLARYPTRGAAEADWDRLTQMLELDGLEPRFEELGDGVRLFVGPFTDCESAQGMCFDLGPAAGACEPSGFQGVLN